MMVIYWFKICHHHTGGQEKHKRELSSEYASGHLTDILVKPGGKFDTHNLGMAWSIFQYFN